MSIHRLKKTGTRTGQKAQPEFELQATFAEWLRWRHPGIYFLSDVRAALKLTIPQQVRQKRLQAEAFAMPDMVIFEPRGDYHALFLEFKADTPYRRDGQLKTSDHLASQAGCLAQLRRLGYAAEFVWSFEQAQTITERYLG